MAGVAAGVLLAGFWWFGSSDAPEEVPLIVAEQTPEKVKPESEGGFLWNDGDIGIDWGIAAADIQLSDKDKKQPLLQEVDCFRYDLFKKEAVYGSKAT